MQPSAVGIIWIITVPCVKAGLTNVCGGITGKVPEAVKPVTPSGEDILQLYVVPEIADESTMGCVESLLHIV